MTQVHVAMMGARMHYAVPLLLDELNLLDRFYTDSYLGNKPWLEKMLLKVGLVTKHRLLLKWLGRRAPISPEKVTSYELLGFYSWWLRRKTRGFSETGRMFAEINQLFNKKVISSGLDGADIVYGCNHASLEIFHYAKQRGMRCILEQTMAPLDVYHELLFEEMDRWPGWQPWLEVRPESRHPNSEREQLEWELADVIVGGSDFVKSTLIRQGVPQEKCEVVPYGIDIQKFETDRKERRGGKLRVLFAGEVGLRKGIPYLLQALAQLGPQSVVARFAGRISVSDKMLKPFELGAQFLGPVPRIRMQELFSWADVFVLPSVCEGSATVTYEALANGLPVVTTPNTGSMVRDGVDGHILPIRDVDGIAYALNRYITQPGHLSEQRYAAMAGRQALSLDAYKERLARTFAELASRSPVEV